MMNRRAWISNTISGIAAGACIAMAVALAISYVDWRRNPGGVFHSELGTDWNVVAETAISWFLPLFPVTSVLSIGILFLLSRQRTQRGGSITGKDG